MQNFAPKLSLITLTKETEMTDIEKLLTDRHATHGAFVDHATATQDLKMMFHNHIERRQTRNQLELSAPAHEAIEMILHKIGRIVAGQWDFRDHWDDIAGYARLVADECGLKEMEKELVRTEKPFLGKSIKPSFADTNVT
jgi:hypothetical protein